jgi:bifunctional UDP-N-acetylglucosamine pyrophosphorylase / glucosamine-1-phosphate N-acetyltransferase
MALNIVIMAAGKGTRMKSALPKVLHPLAGLPLIGHVLRTVAPLQAQRVVLITGHGAEQVESSAQTQSASGLLGEAGRALLTQMQFVRQMPQLGTGHAMQQAVPALQDGGTTLILNGDVPLIEAATLQALIKACSGSRLALLTMTLPDASGYGRIVKTKDSGIQGIVEHKDASPEQREIREIYTGVMAAPTAWLKRWLARLTNNNAQGEYYLTDVVAMAVADKVPVVSTSATSETEILGVNSPLQLADLERRYQHQRAHALMEAGVRLLDPARFDVRGELHCGSDVEIDVNCVFSGKVTLGDGVRIGANCVIRNAVIDASAVIQPFTHIDGEALGVKVGAHSAIGPFARLRPGAVLGEDVHIGNFVEVKNATLARGSKANHLAYLGDATVGERVNYGAGSITANYDGANKHRTVIGNDVHVGSNCVLIAPISLGHGSTVGAGSSLTQSIGDGQLAVARPRQQTISGWVRPVKKTT